MLAFQFIFLVSALLWICFHSKWVFDGDISTRGDTIGTCFSTAVTQKQGKKKKKKTTTTMGFVDIGEKPSVILFFFLLLAGVGARADDRDRSDECLPTRCGDEGPEIRFPFWLKDHQLDRCGYGPDFALTCSPTNNETLLDNPFSAKVVVKDIGYYCPYITYEFSGDYALHQQNLSLIFNTSPFSPFQLWANMINFEYGLPCPSSVDPYHDVCEYSIFSCLSSFEDPYNIYIEYAPLPCLSRPGQNLYLLNSDYLIRRNNINEGKSPKTLAILLL